MLEYQQFNEENIFGTVSHLRDFAEELGLDTTCCFGLTEETDNEFLQQMQEALQEEIEKAELEAAITMGRCPMNFAWHREGSGYRCDGGSHFVELKDLHKYMKKNK